MTASHTQPVSSLQSPVSGTADPLWVDGAELPYSARHVRRMFDSYKRLGAAKRQGGRLLFARNHPDIAQLVTQTQRDLSDADDLSDLTDRQRADAHRRCQIVVKGRAEVQRRMDDTGCGRVEAIDWFCKVRAVDLGLAEDGGIHRDTFYRLEDRYNRAGRFKLRNMADDRGRPKATDRSHRAAMTPAAWAFFIEHYMRQSRPKAKSIWRHTQSEAKIRGWDWPHYRTVMRRLKTEINNPQLILAREGHQAFRAQCIPKRPRDYTGDPAGSFWSADEMDFDFDARFRDASGNWKRCRPRLTAFLDVRSRMFVGWHIDHRANSDTIVAAFKRGARDYRIPKRIQCDNGKDYKAVAGGRRKKWDYFNTDHVRGVWDRIGVETKWATPRTPWAKIIESNFRWVHEEFDKVFYPDFYRGKDTQSKPEGVNNIPLMALPTLDQVREDFAEWLIWYHDQPHEGNGIGGLTPNQAFVEFADPEPNEKIDGELLDHLCARPASNKPVVVRRDGVCFNGVMYGTGLDKLIRLQGQKVKLLIHPDRADFVDVCDLDGRMLCRAYEPRLLGADQQDHRMRKAAEKRARSAAKLAAETRHLMLGTPLSNTIRTAIASRRGAPDPNRDRKGVALSSDPNRDRKGVAPDAVRLVAPELRSAFEQHSDPHAQAWGQSTDKQDTDMAHVEDTERVDPYQLFAEQAEQAQGADASDENELTLADVFGGGIAPVTQDEDDEADGFAILAERYGTAG